MEVRELLKALVTGGTGFIGSHLVDVLLDKKWSVRCLVRGNRQDSWLQGLPIERCAGDCRDGMSLKAAVRGVDVIFHLAGVTKARDAKTYFEVNATGTDNLLHACLEVNPEVKTFIYVSSQAAAGPSIGRATTETDRCAPVSDYGRSKLRGEETVFGYSGKVPVVVIRPPVVYGPRDRDLLPFFRLLSCGIRPRLMARGQRFSLCYVNDLVDGLLLTAEKDEARGGIFFVSDGQDYSWDEIGEAFSAACERKTHCVPIPKAMLWACAAGADVMAAVCRKPALLSYGKVKEMVQSGWVCSNNKSRRLLGFKPRIGLQEGAELTFLWYKAAKWL